MSSSRLLLALPAAGETPWVMTFSHREQGGCNVEKPPADAWFGGQPPREPRARRPRGRPAARDAVSSLPELPRASRRSGRHGTLMPFCANCGTEVQAGQHFCASCGAPAAPSAVSGASGARSIGTIAAIVLLAGFLLPWVSCRGVERASGFELAKGQELWGSFPALWLIPIAAVAALILLVAGRGKQSVAGGTMSVLAGIGSVLIMLYYYARLWTGRRGELGDAFREVGRIEYGAYLSLLAAITLALCGVGLIRSGRGAPDQ